MILYILYSEKSKIYYVGITSNLAQRLTQHNFTSKDSFTSKHRPWVLKASFICKNREQASWCEKYIKSQKSKKFIEEVLLDENSRHPLLGMILRLDSH